MGSPPRIARPHTEFGGVKSAIHLISYWGVKDSVFNAPLALPRVLAHILNSASPDAAQEIDSPPALPTETRRSPVFTDSLLCQEGLYNVFRLSLHVQSNRLGGTPTVGQRIPLRI